MKWKMLLVVATLMLYMAISGGTALAAGPDGHGPPEIAYVQLPDQARVCDQSVIAFPPPDARVRCPSE